MTIFDYFLSVVDPNTCEVHNILVTEFDKFL